MTNTFFNSIHEKNISQEVPSPRREKFELFNEPWCKEMFSRPDLVYVPLPNRRPSPPDYQWCTNTLLSKTMWTDDALRAWCNFLLSDPNNTAWPYELCNMAAIGTGVDGFTGRGHGGLTSMLFDICFGMTAFTACKANATLKMEIEYKRAVRTPCLLLTRVKVVKMEGNKCWMKATLGDGRDKVFANAKAVFAIPKGADTGGDPRGKHWLAKKPEGKL